MRGRLAAIGSRYDAIEKLIERLVAQSEDGGAGAAAAAGDSDEVDESLAAFFAASGLSASAVELPSFLRFVQALQTHARGSYQPPSKARLSELLQ